MEDELDYDVDQGGDTIDALPTRHVSFQRRCTSTTRLATPTSGPSNAYDAQSNDFISLMTAVADLYAQEDVLEMLAIRSRGKYLTKGGVSQVSTIYAAFTRPSKTTCRQITRKERSVILKASPDGMFFPNGTALNRAAARIFITEMRILSHPGLRSHKNVTKALGLQWDFSRRVGAHFPI